ncbi:hypothetical protein DFH07DRAFT_957820 [Mycena maculata]|uniref:Uncharacterized protein n=1 Tax=Mycena maculata TaxID=230809 RepID=A0AAD7NGV1_9AGAR|nr:hypothetical protein DFH07DRAFT_957820 [Mycena maculata]
MAAYPNLKKRLHFSNSPWSSLPAALLLHPMKFATDLRIGWLCSTARRQEPKDLARARSSRIFRRPLSPSRTARVHRGRDDDLQCTKVLLLRLQGIDIPSDDSRIVASDHMGTTAASLEAERVHLIKQKEAATAAVDRRRRRMNPTARTLNFSTTNHSPPRTSHPRAIPPLAPPAILPRRSPKQYHEPPREEEEEEHEANRVLFRQVLAAMHGELFLLLPCRHLALPERRRCKGTPAAGVRGAAVRCLHALPAHLAALHHLLRLGLPPRRVLAWFGAPLSFSRNSMLSTSTAAFSVPSYFDTPPKSPLHLWLPDSRRTTPPSPSSASPSFLHPLVPSGPTSSLPPVYVLPNCGGRARSPEWEWDGQDGLRAALEQMVAVAWNMQVAYVRAIVVGYSGVPEGWDEDEYEYDLYGSYERAEDKAAPPRVEVKETEREKTKERARAFLAFAALSAAPSASPLPSPTHSSHNSRSSPSVSASFSEELLVTVTPLPPSSSSHSHSHPRTTLFSKFPYACAEGRAGVEEVRIVVTVEEVRIVATVKRVEEKRMMGSGCGKDTNFNSTSLPRSVPNDLTANTSSSKTQEAQKLSRVPSPGSLAAICASNNVALWSLLSHAWTTRCAAATLTNNADRPSVLRRAAKKARAPPTTRPLSHSVLPAARPESLSLRRSWGNMHCWRCAVVISLARPVK